CSVCCVCSDRQSSTSIFTLSLHDALPICLSTVVGSCQRLRSMGFTSRKPSTCWMGTPDSATSRESQAASAARPAGVRLQNVMGMYREEGALGALRYSSEWNVVVEAVVVRRRLLALLLPWRWLALRRLRALCLLALPIAGELDFRAATNQLDARRAVAFLERLDAKISAGE